MFLTSFFSSGGGMSPAPAFSLVVKLLTTSPSHVFSPWVNLVVSGYAAAAAATGIQVRAAWVSFHILKPSVPAESLNLAEGIKFPREGQGLPAHPSGFLRPLERAQRLNCALLRAVTAASPGKPECLTSCQPSQDTFCAPAKVIGETGSAA